MDDKKIQVYFFLIILTISFLLSFLIFRPYLSLLVLAGTLAILAEPLHRKILKIMGNRHGLATLITTILVAAIFLTPLILFSIQVVKEARGLYGQMIIGGDYAQGMLYNIQKNFQKLLPNYSWDLSSFVKQILTWIVQHIGAIFSSATKIAINILLGLIAIFYLLKDGGKLKDTLMKLSPLSDKHDNEIFNQLKQSIHSVVRGSLFLAILHGILIGVGFRIFGVPNAAFWGMVLVVAALIPAVGIALILIPAVIFLFLTGHSAAGIGLLVWGMITSIAVDNIIGPKIMQKGTRMHPLVILFSVLGGIAFFGPLGFLLGPITLSLFFTLLRIYPEMTS